MERLDLFKHALINGVGPRASGYEVMFWPGTPDAALAYDAVKARLFWIFATADAAAAPIAVRELFDRAIAISALLGGFVTPDQDLWPLRWIAGAEAFSAYAFKVYRGPATLLWLERDAG